MANLLLIIVILVLCRVLFTLCKQIFKLARPKRKICYDLTSKDICLTVEHTNEFQETDVVLNVTGAPFITLTESKIRNTWYHHDLDQLFCLTRKGFKVIRGSKKNLIERGFCRNEN